jgi:5'-phosphate synthase pdxT subunit
MILNGKNTCEIISEYKNIPVLVEENNFLACSFHPEITKDYSIYEYFLT